MKIICPLCELENEEDARFCSNCNTPLINLKVYKATEKPWIKIKKRKPANKFFKSSEVNSRIEKKQLLGLIGSIILFVGVFAPLVSVPIMKNMNYFPNGKGDVTSVLVLVVVSLVLVLLKKFKGLWFTGLGSMAIRTFTFIRFQMRMSDLKTQMEIDPTVNLFREIADMAMQSVQLQLGWALIIIGASLLIASAAIKEK